METKKQIRKKSLQKRVALSTECRCEYSHRIAVQILSHPFFQRAAMLCSYVPFREEVDTREVIEAAWNMGKCVAVPKVTGAQEMEFFEITCWDDLEEGYQGILEPRSHCHCCTAKEGMAALMLLPGAAFDKQGNRIGYGKGFYDSYLKRYPIFDTMGLAFSVQCEQSIPAEPHDIAVDLVITEHPSEQTKEEKKGKYWLCVENFQRTQ